MPPAHPTDDDRDQERDQHGALQHDLERALRRRGLLPQVQAAWVLSVANTVGKGRFQAVAWRDHELVCVAGTLPAAELQFASDTFRIAINKKLGQDLVRTIRFKNSQTG